MKNLVLVCISMGLGACASLHHVQIGEIDSTSSAGARSVRFELMESATGVNVREAGEIAKGLSRSAQVDRASNALSDIYEMLTFGPRTGEVVFNDTFPNSLPARVSATCKAGKVSGLLVVRETNKYPVVSGEIVRVTGYCID